MTIRIVLFSFLLSFSLISCGKQNKQDEKITEKTPEYTKFNGSYKAFNDLNELHMAAALEKGIVPMQTNADTTKYADKLVRLPQELDLYKIDKLTHSVPFVVNDAAQLMMRIGINFRDSLFSKKMAPYKLIITSVTRSLEDNARLGKKNVNAVENSVHSYGTTVDISWKRFVKKGTEGNNDVPPEQLKYVLAQVLHDLRQREQCYVLYETKQACFHITVR